MRLKNLFAFAALFAVLSLSIGCGSKTETKTDCDKGKCVVPVEKKGCGGGKPSCGGEVKPEVKVDPSK